MINPTNEREYGKLYRAVERSRWLAQPFRLHRLSFLREFVGSHYSATGSPERVPLNVLQLAINIYLRQLAPRAPRAMCTTQEVQFKPIAADMESWMDKASAGMRLDETFRMWVQNAMFGLGVLKIAEAAVSDVELHDSTIAYIGQPFAEVVDDDDWVMDMLAKRKDQCSFLGNRYRVRLSDVKDNKDFDATARANVEPMYRHQYNERGDERPTTLQAGFFHPTIDEIEDFCELWDIYLPRENLLVTFPYHDHVTGGPSGPPLRVAKWTGPREGPYHLLTLADVPDNIMPVPPASMWMDLHELVNRILNKLGEQSDRQKTVVGYQSSALDDASRLMNSVDGQLLKMEFPDKVREYRFGGADRDQMLFLESMKQLFSWQAGNLDTQGGLSAQTSTFHGDELLHGQTSAQMDEMKNRVTMASQRAYQALGMHWWTNPSLTYRTSRQEAGMDIPVEITPQMRQIPWDKLNVEIDPYSLTPDTPESRGQKLMQFTQQFLLPLQPALQQAGMKTDWPALMGLFAKYLSLPDLANILIQGPPPDQQGAAAQAQSALQDGPGMAPNTTRTNIRKSVASGATDRAHGQVLQQLLSGGANGQQKAGFLRPGS